MKRLRYLIFIFWLCWLGACQTPDSRVGELQASHPQWSQEKLYKISRGMVEKGMTKEEVREALKSVAPLYFQAQDGRWMYVELIDWGRDLTIEFGKVLVFENDRVVEIRNFQRIPEIMFYQEW